MSQGSTNTVTDTFTVTDTYTVTDADTAGSQLLSKHLIFLASRLWIIQTQVSVCEFQYISQPSRSLLPTSLIYKTSQVNWGHPLPASQALHETV